MPKGTKILYPFYAKKDDVIIKGMVNLQRLTPKTFNEFIKTTEGPDVNPDDYYILDLIQP